MSQRGNDPASVALPEGGLAEKDDAAGRQAVFCDLPASQFPPVVPGLPRADDFWRDARRRLAVQDANGDARPFTALELALIESPANEAQPQVLLIDPVDRRGG